MSTIIEANVEALGAECGKSFAAYLDWLPTKTRADLTIKEQWGSAMLGLIGEIGELIYGIDRADTVVDWMRLPDEVGDVLFYHAWLVNLARSESNQIPEILEFSDDFSTWLDEKSNDPDIAADSILGYAASLAEVVKKHVFHGKDNTVELYGYLSVIGGMIAEIAHGVCRKSGMPGGLGRIVERNVIKLEARYPSGFVLGGGIRESE